MAKTDFWDECWQSEDREAIGVFQVSWSRSCGDLAELFRAHNVRTVCDAACGFGAYALAFAAQGFTISAFDISPAAVELTKQGLAYLNLDAEVKVASILATGYPDAAFDAAVASAVLDHLTARDAQEALAELYRIVRPGGLVLLTFDGLMDGDLQEEHEILPDGSFRYTDNTPWPGMIFRPYDQERLDQLLAGKTILYERTSGRRTIVLKK